MVDPIASVHQRIRAIEAFEANHPASLRAGVGKSFLGSSARKAMEGALSASEFAGTLASARSQDMRDTASKHSITTTIDTDGSSAHKTRRANGANEARSTFAERVLSLSAASDSAAYAARTATAVTVPSTSPLTIGSATTVADLNAVTSPTPANGILQPIQTYVPDYSAASLAYASSKGQATMASNDPTLDYGRAETLTQAAQMQDVVNTGTFLAAADGPGLSVLNPDLRAAADPRDIQMYQELIPQLMAKYGFTQVELDAEVGKVERAYAAGFAYNPGVEYDEAGARYRIRNGEPAVGGGPQPWKSAAPATIGQIVG